MINLVSTKGNPILNKNYDLGLKAQKIEEIDSVETEIKINNDFKDYEVKFNDDFDGSASYDAKNSVIKITATRKEGVSTQSGKGNIATISFKVPKELKKGRRIYKIFCNSTREYRGISTAYNKSRSNGSRF